MEDVGELEVTVFKIEEMEIVRMCVTDTDEGTESESRRMCRLSLMFTPDYSTENEPAVAINTFLCHSFSFIRHGWTSSVFFLGTKQHSSDLRSSCTCRYTR